MRIVKMSLVAAVAVASLSTASLADEMMMNGGIKMSGTTDFTWKSIENNTSKNELTDGTVTITLSAPSKDGKGNVHTKFKAIKDGGELKLDKAYVDYKLGMLTLVAGSKMVFPGNFSNSTVRGLAVSTKVAGFTIGAGIADADTGMEDTEKSIITAKGKVAIADLRLDYRLGANKMDYLATDVTVKVGPATIIGGYAAGMGDNNKDMSLMGADVSVGLGMVTAYGAFSLSGKNGGKSTTEKADKTNALGGITGANGAEATAMKFGAKAKVAGVAVHGYYSMATPDGGKTDTKIYVDAKKSLNAQSTVAVSYTMATPGDTAVKATNTIGLTFASKF